MLFCVSAYSYFNWTHDLFLIARQARQDGFDGLEVLDLPCNPEEETAYAGRLRTWCDSLGLKLVCMSVGADLKDGCGGDLQSEIARLCRKADTAAALGVKLMRHDVAWKVPEDGSTFDSFLPRFAQGCRAVTEYAAQKGIRTMSENHGFFVQHHDRMRALVQKVDHPNYGALVDMGNFLCVDDEPTAAVGAMLPYAFHVHCKDFHVLQSVAADPGKGFFRSAGGAYLRGAILGHGNVNVSACLDILRSGGYKGALVLEFEGLEEPRFAVRTGLENMKRFWGKEI